MAPQPGTAVQAKIGLAGVGGFAPRAYDKIFANGRDNLNIVVIHMPAPSSRRNCRKPSGIGNYRKSFCLLWQCDTNPSFGQAFRSGKPINAPVSRNYPDKGVFHLPATVFDFGKNAAQVFPSAMAFFS